MLGNRTRNSKRAGVCLGIAVAVVALLATGCGATADTGGGGSATSTTANIPANTVVATFKGGTVTYGEMMNQYNLQRGLLYPTAQGTRSELNDFLPRYIAEYRVLYAKATAAKITGEASDVTQLANSFKQGIIQQNFQGDQNQFVGLMQHLNVTDADITQWAKKTVALDAYSRSLVNKVVTDEEAKKFYIDNPTQFTTGIVDQIVVATKAEADKVEAELKAGANFTALAKKVSIDPSVKQNGGTYSNIAFNNLAPEVATVCLTQKGGVVSAPVQTQYGWFVVRVDQRQSTPFTQVDQPIRMQIVENRTQAELESLISEQEKTAGIKITLPASIK